MSTPDDSAHWKTRLSQLAEVPDQRALDTIVSIAEYSRDLSNEAIDICAGLYRATPNRDYLRAIQKIGVSCGNETALYAFTTLSGFKTRDAAREISFLSEVVEGGRAMGLTALAAMQTADATVAMAQLARKDWNDAVGILPDLITLKGVFNTKADCAALAEACEVTLGAVLNTTELTTEIKDYDEEQVSTLRAQVLQTAEAIPGVQSPGIAELFASARKLNALERETTATKAAADTTLAGLFPARQLG